MDSRLFPGDSCRGCHPNVMLKNHRYRCIVCHKGDDRAGSQKEAHKGIIYSPSSFRGAEVACAMCHKEAVKAMEGSSHYTLKNEINKIWRAFFPMEDELTVFDLMKDESTMTLKGLILDLMRRRCVVCHVYSRGEGYPGAMRRLGCGACHIGREGGYGVHYIKGQVDDRRCLSCHYANFVGWDYYGRFEKDIVETHQAPYRSGQRNKRDYGVQWLSMAQDIHFKLGYGCTVCHKKWGCSGHQEGIKDLTCTSCHKEEKLFKNPVHTPRVIENASCAVCHAVWSFEDRQRSLVRQDIENYWAWYELRFQGIKEIESLLSDAYSMDLSSFPPPVMSNPFTGKLEQGIWYESFLERRFWPVTIKRWHNDRYYVMRPLLDLRIYYVDGDGMCIVDDMKPVNALNDGGYIPYMPHTIGRADLFRTIEILGQIGSLK